MPLSILRRFVGHTQPISFRTISEDCNYLATQSNVNGHCSGSPAENSLTQKNVFLTRHAILVIFRQQVVYGSWVTIVTYTYHIYVCMCICMYVCIFSGAYIIMFPYVFFKKPYHYFVSILSLPLYCPSCFTSFPFVLDCSKQVAK